jgi:Domain of unknown function (DUF1844)
MTDVKEDTLKGNREITNEKGAGPACDPKTLFSELGFSTFILSLSTSALVHLGELPDPVTSEKGTNLQLAKQTIGVIELLKEKTKGNLTNEEEKLIDTVLYDIRLKYVKAAC